MIWNPRSFHIELTNACVARCPFCARTKEWIPSHQELLLTDIQKFFTKEVLDETNYVNLCGAYGDPIYARDFLEIMEYFTNNWVRVLVSTNGYNSKVGFWEKLWNMWNVKFTFWIDGTTQKTHGNYRRWTKLLQVLKNAKRYTDAWWDAVWQFLLFGNNEHQVWRAKELSEQLWFSDFVVRDSRSYDDELPAPKISVKKMLPEEKSKNWKQFNCEYDDRKEWYINAYGQVLPCCYLGNMEYDNPVLLDEWMNIRKNSKKQIIQRAFWKNTIWRFIDWWGGNICEKKCKVNWNIQRYSVNTKKVF